MQQKGTIIRLKNKKAIVFAKDNHVYRIRRKPDMEINQEIEFTYPEYDTKRIMVILLQVLAGILIIFSLYYVSKILFMPQDTVFAYIDLDVNPSIEFAVDKNMNVLSSKALNTDAKDVLDELKLKNLPVEEALTKTLNLLVEKKFIQTDKKSYVLFSCSLNSSDTIYANMDNPNSKSLQNMINMLKKEVSEIEGGKVIYSVVKSTPELWAEASKNHISIGRYLIYNNIKEKGTEISLSEAQTSPVDQLVQEFKDASGNTPESLQKDEIVEGKMDENLIIVKNDTGKDNVDSDNQAENNDDGGNLDISDLNSDYQEATPTPYHVRRSPKKTTVVKKTKAPTTQAASTPSPDKDTVSPSVTDPDLVSSPDEPGDKNTGEEPGQNNDVSTPKPDNNESSGDKNQENPDAVYETPETQQ